jgi:FtsH-binding integral membrane protein
MFHMKQNILALPNNDWAEVKTMEGIFAAITIPTTIVAAASVLGIFYRRDPKAAPTWAAYGVVISLVGYIVSTIILLIEIFRRF